MTTYTAEASHQFTALEEQLAAAHAREAMYLQILDAVPDLVLCKGPQSRILYANKAFRDCYGMSMDELTRMIDAPFVEPDQTLQYIKDDEQVFSTGETLDIPEEPLTRHDGEMLFVHTVKTVLRDNASTIIGIIAVSQDITELKQTDEALHAQIAESHETQNLLEVVIESLPIMLFLKDAETLKFVRWNTAAEQLTGFGRADILGKSDHDFFPAEQADAFNEKDRQILRSGTDIKAVEEPIDTLHQGTRTLYTHKRAVLAADGTPKYLVGVSFDITERKEAERNLQVFKALAENAVDGFSLAALDGRFTYANAAYQAMTGYGVALLDKTIFETCAEPRERMEQLTQTILATGSWQGEILLQQPDGNTLSTSLSAFMITDDDGQPSMFAAIARDLTAQQRAEQERLALQEQIIAAQDATLRELSTPLIPLGDNIVALPLVGGIDSQRAQQIIDTLLQGVAEQRAATAIIDITGVPVVDTQVANTLIRAAQAVNLLGAQVVLTGIRPEVAQTLVGLGTELRGIVTRSTLQSGIAYALKR